MKPSAEFDEILSNFDPDVQQLAKSVRKLIFDVLPQTVEVPWVQQKVIG
mgnify:CR=1 FL=1